MDTLIRYLHRSQIDAIKWDRCLDNSANGLIYGCSEYLDAMADNWNGLVVGDYDAVIPLPWRSKWGMAYYYHPAFIQQLGLFGQAVKALHKETMDRGSQAEAAKILSAPALYKEIMDVVFSRVRYGDLLLNFGNADIASQIGAAPCNNLILDLSGEYASLSAGYKKDLVNNLRKASKHHLHYLPDNDVSNAVALYEAHYAQRLSSLEKKDYRRFAGLCAGLQRQNRAFARKVVDDGGTLLSIALFLKDSRRIYNMMNTTTDAGRAVAANHFLLDNVIKEFAGAPLALDLEGSDLQGVKHFYLNFGAGEQPYFKYSRLPVALRLWRALR
ncbi:MAG: hypothetical protein JNL51_07960 [Chitinophagaceae bacterium]|nr:hypothetical protein [Chitinophagaceae bacterium]